MSVPSVGTESNIKLDFSQNTNPLGMPEEARSLLFGSTELWSRFPDPECRQLVRMLSVHEKIPENQIVCGCGTGDLVQRIIRALKPKKALVCAPGSVIVRDLLEHEGCTVKEIPLLEEEHFAVTSDVADHIFTGTDVIFLCSPNDPTGEVITPYTMSTIVRKCRETETAIICDESFMKFTPRSRRFSLKKALDDNTIILRSLGEIFALSGMPLAYAMFGSEKLARKVRSMGAYGSIAGPVQAAAAVSLRNHVFLRKSRRCASAERKYLSDELTRLGLVVCPSKANYLLLRCELPLDELLLKRGIRITCCADYSGLDSTYFRISLRRHADNQKLVEEIKLVLRQAITEN